MKGVIIMTTTIKEAIKGIENLVIVKNGGGILAIRNNFDSLSFGKGTTKSEIEIILNSTVKDTYTIKGVISDIVRFSI